MAECAKPSSTASESAGGFAILHIIVVAWVILSLMAVPLLLAYRLGKQAGSQEGYLRGYKEGQASAPQEAPKSFATSASDASVPR